jgi:TPR repeat protein
LEKNRIKESIPLFELSGEKGYPAAFLRLQRIYKEESLLDKSSKFNEKVSKYFEWFQNEANTGDAHSQNNLGLCFYDGIGTIQDFKQAVFW